MLYLRRFFIDQLGGGCGGVRLSVAPVAQLCVHNFICEFA